jgi:hypothetical protein
LRRMIHIVAYGVDFLHVISHFFTLMLFMPLKICVKSLNLSISRNQV